MAEITLDIAIADGYYMPMCMCEIRPNVNGTPGYIGIGTPTMVHPVNPPKLLDGESLVFDEPGRCDIIDAHSHHYRIIREQYGGAFLAVRHEDWDERFRLSNADVVITILSTLDSHARYWLMHTIYHVATELACNTYNTACDAWAQAAIENRISVCREGNMARVELKKAGIMAQRECLMPDVYDEKRVRAAMADVAAIPTEALEAGIVSDMLAALQAFVRFADLPQNAIARVNAVGKAQAILNRMAGK